MTQSRVFLAALAAGVASLAASASADVIANWTFEANLPSGWNGSTGTTGAATGPFAAEAGVNAASSFASGLHASSATLYTAPVGNGSAKAYNANTWAIGDYFQFTTSTVGYSSITIQWDQVSSNTGPREFNLQWSTDGSSFSNIGSTYNVRANAGPAWSSGSGSGLDTFGAISVPAGASNQATVYFRLRMATTVSAAGGVVATGGTSRVDNVIIGGVLPAPASLALLGVGGLLAGRRRRA